MGGRASLVLVTGARRAEKHLRMTRCQLFKQGVEIIQKKYNKNTPSPDYLKSKVSEKNGEKL